MARAIGKLAPAKVSALLRGGAQKRHADGGNLYLQVTGPGSGSWLFRYAERGSSANGAKPRTHWLGLGPVHSIGLAAAREKARELRQQLLEGTDPAARRQAAKGAAPSGMTFAEAAELYIGAHEAAWRSPVHARQWRNSLRDHVLPLLGSVPVAAVGTAEVMQVLDPIWRVKAETASRCRQRIEAILDYAAAREWRTGENPARWRGHLAKLLPEKETVAPVQHHPAMDWQDVPAFMASLATRQGNAARALRFLILTATRSAEARGTTWDEIDFSGGVWTIPAERMKGAREHRIPLTGAALAILGGVRPSDADPVGLVFPGAADGKPLSDVALAKLLPPVVTCHGFRSTFRTWAGETTDYPREVVEMALAHRIGDAVEQAYARGDLFQRRRRLMEHWSGFCGRVPEAVGNVVELRGQAEVAA